MQKRRCMNYTLRLTSFNPLPLYPWCCLFCFYLLTPLNYPVHNQHPMLCCHCFPIVLVALVHFSQDSGEIKFTNNNNHHHYHHHHHHHHHHISHGQFTPHGVTYLCPLLLSPTSYQQTLPFRLSTWSSLTCSRPYLSLVSDILLQLHSCYH